LLFADFFIWEHVSGTMDISTEEVHLPAHIQGHVDYVTPGSRLRTRRAKPNALQKRAVDALGPRRPTPKITKLPGFPYPNSTSWDIYVAAECTRGEFSITQVGWC